MGRDALMQRLEAFRSDDLDWRSGRVWAYVFDPGEEASSLIKEAYAMYLTENGLDPSAFPSLVKMEREVVAMCADHLGAGESDDVVGNFTSGGTESIILAVKTARDWARANKPEIVQPEMVLPTTAHAAFHKAAHYLGLKLVLVDVEPETFMVTAQAMEDAITPNTVLLVGSAVSYAHNVVDPIVELGALAQSRSLLFHVDGCMGGFFLPLFRDLGRDVPAFDFSVPGVTSISMDLHKYAFAAKGASVVLYRDRELRRHQIFSCADWMGYTLTNPTVQSSKTGGPVAGAWAAMHHFGREGYLELARVAAEATDRLVAHLEGHPDLRLLGTPVLNQLSFSSDTIDVFFLADEMKARGWYLQPQFAYAPSPANLHICINPASTRWMDELIADLDASVEAVRGKQVSPVVQQIDGMLAQIGKLEPAMIREMMKMLGLDPGEVRSPDATLNQILDRLSPQIRNAVLIEAFNEIFT